MSSAMCPLGISQSGFVSRNKVSSRVVLASVKSSKACIGGISLYRFTFRTNVLRQKTLEMNASHGGIVCSAAIENPFKYPRQMNGLQSILSQLPTVGVYVLGVGIVAALGGAGFTAGESIVPDSFRTAGKSLCAAIGAAIGGYATLKLKEVRESAAIIELANTLVQLDNPALITREQVTAIETKYGTSLTISCLDELKSLYGTFVEAAIPYGNSPLTGSEQLLILSFKNALGLTDVDAAPVHIDVGRRILRGRLEAGSRGEDIEARKTFQKLIYISNLVFGERQAAFLLPWARIFGLTDAQIQVARRDNARSLFASNIAAAGGLKATREALSALKTYQAEVRLADDEATTVIQEAAQKILEVEMDTAIECIKRRGRARDFSDALNAVRRAVEYNRALASFRSDDSVPSGVDTMSLQGTEWEAKEGRSKDLRDLFKVFLEESVEQANAFSESLENDATSLRVIIGLGPKEAGSIEEDVKEKAYRKLLREEVTSGRLDAASSKAEVLGELVDKVRWDSDAAMELHKSLYRQKLSSLLEKKALSQEDDAELARLQRLLCIPNDHRNAVHAELCGGLFREAVSKAMAAGIDGFCFEDRESVKKSFEDLRLERSVAKSIVDEIGRKYLLQFITASRNQRDRINSSKELKKMVFFSNIVIAPLVEGLKTQEEREKEEAEAKAQRELQELMAKARADAEKEERKEAAGEETSSPGETEAAAAATMAEGIDEDKEEAGGEEDDGEVRPKSLEKAQAAAAARATGERVGESGNIMKSQKDVNLAKDLDVRDRIDTYRNFLLYCMTGDVVQGPMGVQMVTERDESEFARLSQLGDVLGLSQMDVYGVHQGLAEQAFKSQVQQYMGDGAPLTPDRAATLESIREKMGLPKESADKIIKGFQNQKLISSMQAAKAQGNLTLDRILELKDAGVEVSSLVSGDMLQQLYRQEIAARLSDGTGNFDAEKLLHQLPADLGMEADKAAKVAKELATERRRTTLVQAVSFLRQKKVSDAIKSLNNLKACSAALPDSAPEAWGEKDEVADLYGLYCSKEGDEEKRVGVQAALGLDDGEASSLRDMVESGQFKLGQEAEEEAAFF